MNAQDVAPATAGSTMAELIARLDAAADDAETSAARTALAAAVDRSRPIALEAEARDAGDIAAFIDGSLRLMFAAVDFDAPRVEEIQRAVARFPVEADRQHYGCYAEQAFASLRAQHGRFEEARLALRSAVERYSGAVVELPYLLNQLADLERLCGHWNDALSTLDRCELSLYDRRSSEMEPYHSPARVTLLATRAQLCIDLGLPDRAAACLDDVRPLAARREDAKTDYTLALLDTRLDLLTDKPDRAVKRLDPILRDPLAYARQPGWRAALRLGLGMALSDLEFIAPARTQRAEKELREALAEPELSLDDRRMGEGLLAGFLLRRGRIDEARAQLAVARKVLDRSRVTGDAVALPDPAAAVLAAYASRISTLRNEDPERSAACLSELRAAYDAFLARWRELPTRAGGVGLLHYSEHRFITAELVRQSLRVEGEGLGAEHAWDSLSRVHALGSLSRTLGAEPVDLARFRRELLSPSHGLLVYLPSSAPSLLFAIDAEHAVAFELPSKDEINPLRLTLVELVSHPPEPGATAASKDLEQARAELAAVLLPTKLRELLDRWSAVTIVGAELLDGVPFECLPLAGGGSLGTEKAVDYLPSLALGPLLRARSLAARAGAGGSSDAEARPSLWIVAAPTAPAELAAKWPALAPIPFGADDARRLGQAYPKGSVRVFTGEQASLASLENGASKNADVLQLIVHGLSDSLRERPAGLCLAPSASHDGRLWCEQVDGLREIGSPSKALAVPRLVVLASCAAARGPARYGEDGLNNLGGAFLAAGASCVVLSRYEVDYHAAQAFMELFHERLRRGDSPAEAAHVARAALSRDTRYAHPFYYALMQVIGDGQEPVFPR